MIHDAMVTIGLGLLKWASAVGIVAAVAVALVMAAAVVRIVWNRIHALRWLARRRAAQAGEREPDMPIPLCGGARPPAKAR